MRQDLLTGGTPKRLTHHQGMWVLEVERLVALDGTVFRPHTQELEGPEQIAAYFRRNPQARQLAQGLQRLLESSTGVVTTSFEAVAGEWVPSNLAPENFNRIKREVKAEARHDERLQLIEVRTELYRLRAECRWLKERLAKLEQRVGDGGLVAEAARLAPSAGTPGYVGAAVAPLASVRPANDVGVAPDSEATTGADDDAAEQQGGHADAVAPERASAGDVEPAVEPKHLLLPGADDLSRCLRQLVGGDVSSEETDKRVNLQERGQVFFVSALIDDDGIEAGAIVLDLKAAVYLGGTLMMIPEATLEAQVARKEPSEDCLEASAEVCNSLTGAINKVAENLHVLAAPLIRLEADKLPWLTDTSHRIDLIDSFGGRLAVVAR